MKKLFYLLTAILVLAACDTSTNYRFFLKNDSSFTVVVSGVNIKSGQPFNKEITAGDNVEITTSITWGKSKSFIEPSSVIDSLLVINAMNDTLQKDYHLGDNWTKSIKKEHRNNIQLYVFSFENSDF